METLDFKFKFKWVNEQGQETGVFSKKGRFDGTVLHLDDSEIPAAAFSHVDVRGNRMILATTDENGEPLHFVIALTKGKVEKLKQAIGLARSTAWAEMHRKELEKSGRGHEFRQVDCPNCAATLDLTGYPETSQVSCDFCHTVSTLPEYASDTKTLKAEKSYRLCDECGMFSKPRKFTIFYFYFLLVVWGYRQQETWRCPGCMRPEAWKMLFGNALFLLGLPVAIIQLFRAYGGTDVGGIYAGLDAANLKAKDGKLQAAIGDYQKILQKHPVSAGVKYNLGLAFLNENDVDNAARSMEFSLKDCSNYPAPASALLRCYEQLGETDNLNALKQQWEVEDKKFEPASP